MSTLKYSRAREAILSFLKTRKDHPTADVIYENVRQQYPKVSLGTIYRNLSLLADTGQIAKLTFGDGREHFDWDARPHNHFVCRSCGAVLDIDCKTPGSMVRNAAITVEPLSRSIM